MPSHNWKRGEITTAIAIAAVVFLAVSTFVSNIFLSKGKQTTKSLAADVPSCPSGDKDDNNWYCAGECADQPIRDLFTNDCRDKPENCPEVTPALKWRNEKARNCNIAESQCKTINTCSVPSPTPNCNPGKLNIVGACDPACCDPSFSGHPDALCNDPHVPGQTGQACSIQNGYCSKGYSCAVGLTSTPRPPTPTSRSGGISTPPTPSKGLTPTKITPKPTCNKKDEDCESPTPEPTASVTGPKPSATNTPTLTITPTTTLTPTLTPTITPSPAAWDYTNSQYCINYQRDEGKECRGRTGTQIDSDTQCGFINNKFVYVEKIGQPDRQACSYIDSSDYKYSGLKGERIITKINGRAENNFSCLYYVTNKDPGIACNSFAYKDDWNPACSTYCSLVSNVTVNLIIDNKFLQNYFKSGGSYRTAKIGLSFENKPKELEKFLPDFEYDYKNKTFISSKKTTDQIVLNPNGAKVSFDFPTNYFFSRNGDIKIPSLAYKIEIYRSYDSGGEGEYYDNPPTIDAYLAINPSSDPIEVVISGRQ